MSESKPTFGTDWGPDGSGQNACATDPRLQPTPDYGTLGPGSDIARNNPAFHQQGASNPVLNNPAAADLLRAQAKARVVMALAIALGMFGFVVANVARFRNMPPARAGVPISVKDPSQIDGLKPQKQAEALLELAVAQKNGAVEQISSRVDRWQGRLTWDSQMASLTTAALNSSDMRVRESGIEVELAAYGLAKNEKSLDYLVKTVESGNHGRKVWALWALGLMGNRGVDPARVVDSLSAHLKDSDEDSRKWAVDGLALVGNAPSMELLLRTMHDDPSPTVRESAACGLAEAGMFTREERMSAVPQLIRYADDPALDAQTQAWAFQALSDITYQHFGKDTAAWRSWYAEQQNTDVGSQASDRR